MSKTNSNDICLKLKLFPINDEEISKEENEKSDNHLIFQIFRKRLYKSSFLKDDEIKNR